MSYRKTNIGILLFILILVIILGGFGVYHYQDVNSKIVSRVRIFKQNLPDLRTAIWFEPETVVRGETANLYIVVENHSNIPVYNPFSTRVFIKQDGVDFLLDTIEYRNRIDPYNTVYLGNPLPIDTNLFPGGDSSYSVGVEVDYLDEIKEFNNRNNTDFATLIMTEEEEEEESTNLQAVELEFRPSTIMRGESTLAVFTVANTGTTTIPSFAFYLRGPDGLYLSRIYDEPLLRGTQVEIVDEENNLISPSYGGMFTFIVDPHNVISESNESDNETTRYLDVTEFASG